MAEKTYTVEFMSEDQDFNDMPHNLRIKAKDRNEARRKFRAHMKKVFPGEKFKISTIYIETLKLKRVDIK